MSSFNCPQCGKAIIDTPNGYISGCEHYPLEKTKQPLSDFMQSDERKEVIEKAGKLANEEQAKTQQLPEVIKKFRDKTNFCKGHNADPCDGWIRKGRCEFFEDLEQFILQALSDQRKETEKLFDDFQDLAVKNAIKVVEKRVRKEIIEEIEKKDWECFEQEQIKKDIIEIIKKH